MIEGSGVSSPLTPFMGIIQGNSLVVASITDIPWHICAGYANTVVCCIVVSTVKHVTIVLLYRPKWDVIDVAWWDMMQALLNQMW